MRDALVGTERVGLLMEADQSPCSGRRKWVSRLVWLGRMVWVARQERMRAR